MNNRQSESRAMTTSICPDPASIPFYRHCHVSTNHCTFVLGLEELAFSSHTDCYCTEFRGMGVRVHDELVGHVVAVDLVRHKPTPIIDKGANLLQIYE